MTPAAWLRILVYQNLPGVWVARSLERDIAVEGATSETAIERILEIVFAHIAFDQRHGRAPLSTFPEAPFRYWQAFASAAPLRHVACAGNGHNADLNRGILIALAETRPLAPNWRLAPVYRTGLRPGLHSTDPVLERAIRTHDPRQAGASGHSSAPPR